MIAQIAKTCHAVHLAYCKSIDYPTQPIWEELTTSHKNIIIDTVKQILIGEVTSVSQSHDNFVAKKLEQGWRFGENYSMEGKVNPRLCPFNQLSIENQTKEILFFNTVKSFM